jgi:hypothetical protein
MLRLSEKRSFLVYHEFMALQARVVVVVVETT